MECGFDFGVVMEVFLKELRAEAWSYVPWVAWVTISVAVAIAGPFGSYSNMSLAERVVFWTPLVLVGVAVSSMLRAYVYGVLGLHGTLRGSLLITALNCIVVCPPLYGLLSLMMPPMFGGLGHFFEIFLLVSSISLGVCALRSVPAADEEEPSVVHPKQPRLLRRIAPELQGEVWAITVRDHYVDVQTSRGKSSLLMRFSDAINEVDCQPGAQVHRSHWVAWAGVGSVCREGGKMILHLKNGHQIPVSRNNRDKVEAVFPLLADAKTVAA